MLTIIIRATLTILLTDKCITGYETVYYNSAKNYNYVTKPKIVIFVASSILKGENNKAACLETTLDGLYRVHLNTPFHEVYVRIDYTSTYATQMSELFDDIRRHFGDVLQLNTKVLKDDTNKRTPKMLAYRDLFWKWETRHPNSEDEEDYWFIFNDDNNIWAKTRLTELNDVIQTRTNADSRAIVYVTVVRDGDTPTEKPMLNASDVVNGVNNRLLHVTTRYGYFDSWQYTARTHVIKKFFQIAQNDTLAHRYADVAYAQYLRGASPSKHDETNRSPRANVVYYSPIEENSKTGFGIYFRDYTTNTYLNEPDINKLDNRVFMALCLFPKNPINDRLMQVHFGTEGRKDTTIEEMIESEKRMRSRYPDLLRLVYPLPEPEILVEG